MIVVVIIGLLAAMAIPAFQKVRESSRGSAMDNDARQLASAAQQHVGKQLDNCYCYSRHDDWFTTLP
ncbi:MAG: hypothetical protein ACKVGW_16300 [Verrucomicrobiia bacterium]